MIGFEIDLNALDALSPDKRRAALRALRDIDEAQKSNPLWSFDPLNPANRGVPHVKQHAWLGAHTVNGRNVKRRVFVGGNRAGKTTSGVAADIIDLCDAEAIPPHLRRYKRWHGPVHMFFVGVNSRAIDTIAIPAFQKWVPKAQLVGGRWDRAYNKELKRLTFKNGSWLQFMTHEMEVAAFQGAALHRVHFDEEPLFDHGKRVWDECMARLIDHGGDVLVTMTPTNGMTWLFDEVYAPWEEVAQGDEAAFVEMGEQGVTYLCVVDMDDNPTLNEEGKAEALAGYDEANRAARKSGRFVSFEGKIFDTFSRARHVVPAQVALDHAKGALVQRVIGGLDPGFRHMAGAVWVALDHEGVWVFAEEALKETVVSAVAGRIHIRSQELEVKPEAWVADPAIERRDHQTGLSDRAAYAKAGIRTALGVNDVRPGINRIRLLLEAREGDEKLPLLHVSADCEELIRQFGRYRWKMQKRAENAAPEAPVKRDDHLLDALRYAVMALPDPARAAVQDKRTHHQRIIEEDVQRIRSNAGRVPTELGDGFFR